MPLANTIRDNAINLFKFLKKLSHLKTKKVLNVDQFESVIYLEDIPKEKESYCLTHHLLNLEDQETDKPDHFEKWVEIKKTMSKPHPKPPSILDKWLKNPDSLENYQQPPEILKYIYLQDTTDQKEEDQIETKHYLEDAPEVQQAWTSYLQEKWEPWACEQKRLRPIVAIYNKLFDIYHKNKLQGENYQVVLGIGLLSTINKKNKPIKRHLITTPLSIYFEPKNGKITIGPCQQNVELSLELDMLETSEIPDHSDQINQKLADFINNFWIKKDFYDCLRSWINTYDPNGQFHKSTGQQEHINWHNKKANNKYPLLTLTPAIIFRKRGQKAFSQFYTDIINHLEKYKLEKNEDLTPSLQQILNHLPQNKKNTNKETSSTTPKMYFPFSANQEQKKIIEELNYHSGIIVQGPPGTGKTHSIANLICHLLASGQKILITSQTDRALKVLKNKLPKDLKPLCVEVLGQDQKSLLEMKTSIETINSQHENENTDQVEDQIQGLEEKDAELQSQLLNINRRLLEIQQNESKTYHQLFDNYSGTATDIAKKLHEEKSQYEWIYENFSIRGSAIKNPISNEEAQLLFQTLKRLKGVSLSLLDKPLDFTHHLPKGSTLKTMIKEEADSKHIIEKHQGQQNKLSDHVYHQLSIANCQTFLYNLSSLISTAQNLINRKVDWVTKATQECLADQDRPWRHLYEETNHILNKNQEVLLHSDKIILHTLDGHHIDRNNINYLVAIIEDFIKQRGEQKHNIRWRLFKSWFCSEEEKKLKKAIRNLEIDGRKIQTYDQVISLQKYLHARLVKYQLFERWKDYVEVKYKNFGKIYHTYKDLLEPLADCLLLHKKISVIKDLLANYPDITEPVWKWDTLDKNREDLKIIHAQKTHHQITDDFQHTLSVLQTYLEPDERAQKNQILHKLMSAYKNRDADQYELVVREVEKLKSDQEAFSKIRSIKDKIEQAKGKLFENLRESIDEPHWQECLNRFEDAWRWKQAKDWLYENNSENFRIKLNKERKDLLDDRQNNLEQLISKKAWKHLLSRLTDDQKSDLKAWAYAVSKIGKGTGKNAPKHRKNAREYMSRCKDVIPAWIMPLYRVVENIRPGSKPFDVVIIDEASQTGAEGFLLNYLAHKIVVVGDNEQISPETIGVEDTDIEILKKKYLQDHIKYADSIGRDYSYYDYCDIQFQSHIQLREHFRCMPEIIAFSNQISYAGRPLIPMRQYGHSRLQPLKHAFVENAIIQGKSTSLHNKQEAKELVDQIKMCIEDAEYKDKTFGIIVLQGKEQIKMIEKELDREIDKKVIEDKDIIVGDPYDFQGDERDVIFLSMVIAPSEEHRRTALTRDMYKKRYNVAASRAKDQMWLFHSIRPDELSSQCFRNKLLTHCIGYKNQLIGRPESWVQDLEEKIKTTIDKTPKNAPDPFDSWFEARVFVQICQRRFLVIPQYSVSRYKIDMVIIGNDKKLAVECDGDIYHGKEQEARDLERQWDLESCGWTFYRLRSSEFYYDPDQALEGLWKQLKKMQIHPQ